MIETLFHACTSLIVGSLEYNKYVKLIIYVEF